MNKSKISEDDGHAKTVVITLIHKKDSTIICNDAGLRLEMPKLADSTIILGMLHQTLLARLDMWKCVSDDFQLELTIKEVIK